MEDIDKKLKASFRKYVSDTANLWKDFALNMPYKCCYNKEMKMVSWFNRYETYLGSSKEVIVKCDERLKDTLYLYDDENLPLTNINTWNIYLKKLNKFKNYHVISIDDPGDITCPFDNANFYQTKISNNNL